MVHHVPEKSIDFHPCMTCGNRAKRDLATEFKSQGSIGMKAISHSSTAGGSAAKEVEFLAGKFKKNPDGTVDKNHRPFRDTGELDRFMNGQNDLGEPMLNEKGTPVRRKDGSIVRKGAKLFKYGKNATPSRRSVRPRTTAPSAWTDEAGAKDGSGGLRSF